MSNIHGLSFGSKDNKDNKDKSKNEEFSVGGQTSSTAVLRPTNTPARDNKPNAYNNNSNNNNNSINNNPGSISASDLIRHAKANKPSSNAVNEEIGTITLYSNGFIIGNGEFRDIINNKTNAQFLEDLKRGEVPVELESVCRNEFGDSIDAVKVNLIDKTSETYNPPKPKFDFSTSKGQSLQSSNNNSNDDSKANFSSAKPIKLVVDNNAPTTTVQIMLSDRRRVKEQINLDSTVFQLYQHIMVLSNRAIPNFELMANYPPKPLTEPYLTIKEAALAGSTIQQR